MTRTDSLGIITSGYRTIQNARGEIIPPRGTVHTVTVGGYDLWQARCECGWRGNVYRLYSEASRDLDGHAETLFPR